jgi:hypothetical protein
MTDLLLGTDLTPDEWNGIDGDDTEAWLPVRSRAEERLVARAARRAKGGTSGLKEARRKIARTRAHDAALLAYHHRAALHYSMGSTRWDGIANHRVATAGSYPRYADCSAFFTWCIWNGVRTFNTGDFVNAVHWQYGYTGSMLRRGHRVTGARVVGVAVFYGNPVDKHVAFYMGGGMVMSNGSEPGPLYLPVHYRSDYHSTRRYI